MEGLTLDKKNYREKVRELGSKWRAMTPEEKEYTLLRLNGGKIRLMSWLANPCQHVLRMQRVLMQESSTESTAMLPKRFLRGGFF